MNQDYIVIQENFYDGTLIRLQNGMYALLKSDDSRTGTHSTIRRLQIELEEGATNGSQDRPTEPAKSLSTEASLEAKTPAVQPTVAKNSAPKAKTSQRSNQKK